jgi:hypothetical protein
MTPCSRHPNRRRVGSLACVCLVLALCGSAGAATLGGRLINSGGGSGDYYVYVVRLDIDSPVAGTDILHTPGRWEVRGLPNGEYFIGAWQDLNRNFIPSRGEPMGFYGDPFPQRVVISANQGRSDLDIELQPLNVGAELRGRVRYAGNQHGRIWVVPHLTQELSLGTARGTPWTMTSPSEYQVYVLTPNTYYITAYMDVNGNLIHDAGEPIGTSVGVDVTITPGVTYWNLDITLQAKSTAVESATWSQVKGMYDR